MSAEDDDYEREMAEIERQGEINMAIALETEIDKEMTRNLTREDVEAYDCPFYELEQLEGNYIEEFERKTREGSIEVSEVYQKYIEENGVPLHAFDPRTGVYGIKYAAAGFFSAGCMYMDDKKWDEAIVNFAKAIELQPRHVPARGYKAKCHLEKKENWRAVCEAWNAIDLNPVMIAERDEKSRAILELFEPEGMEQYARSLISHLLIRALGALNDESYDDALLDFDEIIKRDDGVLNAYHGRIVVYMAFRDWNKVIENCEVLMREHYMELYAIQCRGCAYQELERHDEAIVDFDTALSQDATLAVIYPRRSYYHYLKGNYQKAFEDANEGVKLGELSSYSYRGLAYLALGEYEKSIADFDKWLSIDDEDAWAAKHRKKAVELLHAAKK